KVGFGQCHEAILQYMTNTIDQHYQRILLESDIPMRKRQFEGEKQKGVKEDYLVKPNWIYKHTKLIPSVVLGFYDLLSGKMGEQKDQIIIDDINEKKVRKQFQARGIKVAIVLITEHYYLERLSNCGLENRSTLFLLPTTGVDVNEFISTIETSMKDASEAYYKEEIKGLRKKQAKVAKASLPDWIAHYEFKIAVFYEMRREKESAIKSYYATYTGLIEVQRAKEELSFEEKAFSDAIILKLCHLLIFAENKDIFTLFKRHKKWINENKNCYNYQARMFKLNREFADIVDFAIKQKVSSSSWRCIAEVKKIEKGGKSVIELLTRAYEFFVSNSKRINLFIATLIAKEHYECENYETASKFLEKEGWNSILEEQLFVLSDCYMKLEQYLNATVSFLHLLSISENSQILDRFKGFLSKLGFEISELKVLFSDETFKMIEIKDKSVKQVINFEFEPKSPGTLIATFVEFQMEKNLVIKYPLPLTGTESNQKTIISNLIQVKHSIPKIQLEISHSEINALNENIPLKITLINNESHPINPNLNILANSNLIEFYYEDSITDFISVGQVEKQKTISLTMICKSEETLETNILFICQENERRKTLSISVKFVHPFLISPSFLTLPLKVSFADENRVDLLSEDLLMKMKPSIKVCLLLQNKLCDDLIIHSLRLNINDDFKCLKNSVKLESLVLKESFYNCSFNVVSNDNSSKILEANLTVEFSRPHLQTRGVFNYSLPSTLVNRPSIDQISNYPSCANCYDPFIYEKIIINNSNKTESLSISIDQSKFSEQFVFSGCKSYKFNLIPQSFIKIKWVLVPLVAGLLQLPNIRLSKSGSNLNEENEENENERQEIATLLPPAYILSKPPLQK
ncbi:hypothetical protein ROZALSC1DRAFT_28000, partial [Rozella allomycis CSF55]